jgi:hypothetical protein
MRSIVPVVIVALLSCALLGAPAREASASGAADAVTLLAGDCPLPPRLEAELIELAITQPLYGGPLKYPEVTAIADIAEQVCGLFMPIDVFSDAYDELSVLDTGRECLDGPTCYYEHVWVRYDLDQLVYSAYAYFKESEDPSSAHAALIIPGSGTNQSTGIHRNDPGNYHYNIAEVVNEDWDMFVYVKPNEDFLAIHDGRRKLKQEYLIRPLLNYGGSYSCRYLVDTMAMVKYLKTEYDRVVVIGLSQGGEAALYNSVQSHPDGAVISSGFSVLVDTFVDGGLGQIIVPGMKEHLMNEDVFNGIRGFRTRYLFSWGKLEKGIYKVEAELGCAAEFFSPLLNVTCVSHDMGHVFPEAEIAEFLRAVAAPAAEIEVNPESLAVLFHPTELREETLVVRNSGDGDLNFSLSYGAEEGTRSTIGADSEDSWITVTPETGTVAPGESTLVNVTFDGRRTVDGAYRDVLLLSSNDPFRPSLSIPVSMSVNRGFALYQSVPNPATSTASLAFDLPRGCRTTLRLFDAAGRLVRTLADQELEPGRHVIPWDLEDDDGREAPAGVYVYDMTAGGFRSAKKLVVVR